MRPSQHRSPLRQRYAFTLLEVLLATVIFGMVLAAITLTLRTGLRAWSTGHGLSEVLQTARITREVLMKDLDNMVFINGPTSTDSSMNSARTRTRTWTARAAGASVANGARTGASTPTARARTPPSR